MKRYQVAVQWGEGHRYLIGSKESDDLQAARKNATEAAKRAEATYQLNKERGAKPAVYILKVVK